MCGGRWIGGYVVLATLTLLTSSLQVRAQDPVSAIISTGIVRVIRAFDLQVQRMQTRTILLQTAQKEIENAMQALHLDEIRDWVQNLKDLYGNYFAELWHVKSVISGYQDVKRLMRKEQQLVDAYRRAWNGLREDHHFTAAEREYMESVYGNILEESVQTLDLVLSVIRDLTTQMTDEGRLTIIHEAAVDMDRRYGELVKFNTENALLSLRRAGSEAEISEIKKLYGLE